MARGSQWDVINDPAGEGRYEALVLLFGDRQINEFGRIYAGDLPVAPTESGLLVPPSAALREAVDRAAQSIALPALRAAGGCSSTRMARPTEILEYYRHPCRAFRPGIRATSGGFECFRISLSVSAISIAPTSSIVA